MTPSLVLWSMTVFHTYWLGKMINQISSNRFNPM